MLSKLPYCHLSITMLAFWSQKCPYLDKMGWTIWNLRGQRWIVYQETKKLFSTNSNSKLAVIHTCQSKPHMADICDLTWDLIGREEKIKIDCHILEGPDKTDETWVWKFNESVGARAFWSQLKPIWWYYTFKTLLHLLHFLVKVITPFDALVHY